MKIRSFYFQMVRALDRTKHEQKLYIKFQFQVK